MDENMNLIDCLKAKQHVYEDLLIANKDKFDEKALLHIQMELKILDNLLRELYRSTFRNNVIKWMTKKISDDPDDFMITVNAQIEKDVEDVMGTTDNVVEPVDVPTTPDAPLDDIPDDIPSDVPSDIPDAPPVVEEPSIPVVEQEDYHQLYSPFKFDFANEWRNISNEEKKDIIERVKTLAEGQLSKEELNTLRMLAETPEFVLEKLMENKGEEAVTIQASINSLIDKGLVIEIGKFNNLVFLTKIGVWLYSLSKKQAPIIYKENSSGVFTWQM